MERLAERGIGLRVEGGGSLSHCTGEELFDDKGGGKIAVVILPSSTIDGPGIVGAGLLAFFSSSCEDPERPYALSGGGKSLGAGFGCLFLNCI